MSKPRSIAAICNDLEVLLSEPLQEPDAAIDLADELADHPDGIRAVSLLLLLLEKNPNLDWGAPGAVVHAVERFFKRGYEALLLESLRRSPTGHTLWMANRLINGAPRNQQNEFLSAIRRVAAREDVSEEVRRRALEFVGFQNARG
jgi:hypothetical protein